ncbi:MAG: T9SS type A sorting domain-containing protein [Candidatus Marinimicrobia bacterium]|nr:T9SS type A sorting domain-containing protein [Candidatus Neomarinimicrobiota bacterium]
MKSIIISTILVLTLMAEFARAEDFVFFDDSPTSTSYDASWCFVNAPSVLERIGEKFPVDEETVFMGNNSLRLHWTSQASGNWGAAVAEVGWPGHDLSTQELLTFWMYTNDAILVDDLPNIYLEDTGGQKTDEVNMGGFLESVSIGQWQQYSIPLDTFYAVAGNADMSSIKTIFYGQSSDDANEHTLFLDEIRMTSLGNNDTIAPGIPADLTAIGYERHIDLSWTPVEDEDVAGYRIYRSNWGGSYTLVGYSEKDIPFYNHFIGEIGESGYYKISAVDNSYNESDLTEALQVSTQDLDDDAFLDMIQRATFRYFWDYAHPVSKMALERTPGNGETVTSGGTGFGIMAIVVGAERGFVTRAEAAARLLEMFQFLESADRFHGAWSHWMNGTTGEVIPFSQYDDGGDLVETAFLVQGILAARNYFDGDDPVEQALVTLATSLWESVEWDWYRRTPTSNFLYWHWSPDHEWTMNFALQGPNETGIVYILAAASPTHGIPAELWENGFASSPSYDNGNSYYGINLDVGWPFGGPLFFAHYSYLGFDPRGLQDSHTNYFFNNRNHTLINRAWCIDNPGGYVGYGENCWGLTASDDPFGYLAHEPTPNRDNGTITPTAALSSFPYTPTESLAALHHFYADHGERIFGPFGFYDAFNETQNWYSSSYLAIDQGPIIVMMENHRTGLIWDQFMANPEIAPALESMGFIPDTTVGIQPDNEIILAELDFRLLSTYPNPFNGRVGIRFQAPQLGDVKLIIYDLNGRELYHHTQQQGVGHGMIYWGATSDRGEEVASGLYLFHLVSGTEHESGKLLLIR